MPHSSAVIERSTIVSHSVGMAIADKACSNNGGFSAGGKYQYTNTVVVVSAVTWYQSNIYVWLTTQTRDQFNQTTVFRKINYVSKETKDLPVLDVNKHVFIDKLR